MLRVVGAVEATLGAIARSATGASEEARDVAESRLAPGGAGTAAVSSVGSDIVSLVIAVMLFYS